MAPTSDEVAASEHYFDGSHRSHPHTDIIDPVASDDGWVSYDIVGPSDTRSQKYESQGRHRYDFNSIVVRIVLRAGNDSGSVGALAIVGPGTAVNAAARAVMLQAAVRVPPSELELLVNVPERAVALMKQANGFAAHLDAIPGKLYTAKLRELSPAADAASRTYTARLSITNADDALKLGMSATVRLDLAATQAIVVPNTALYTRDATPRVWVVDRASETVRAVDVKLGESTADGVAVTSGLKAGDIVVTAGANLLLPGQKVRLLDVPAPTTAAPAQAAAPATAQTPGPAKAAPAATAASQAASKP